ncbi:MAG: prepilin peptidase [Actinomycetota bacterium]
MLTIVTAIIIHLTFGAGLAIAVYAAAEDVQTHLLRNVYTGPLAAVAIVGFAIHSAVERTGLPLADLAIGAAVFAGPWLLSFLVSPASIGFGDVKFSAGLGLYLGWIGPATAFRGVFLTSVAGAGLAALALLRGRRREPIAFGPALVIGAVAAVALAELP